MNKIRSALQKLDKERFDILEKIFVICLDYISKNIDENPYGPIKALVDMTYILSQTYYYINNASNCYIIEQESFSKHEAISNPNY